MIPVEYGHGRGFTDVRAKTEGRPEESQMKCTYCGAVIPEGKLKCPVCGKEVRIVPDYNPLEDSLPEEMKESMEGATRPIKRDDIRRYRTAGVKEYNNSTRVIDRAAIDAMRAKKARDTAEIKRRERARQMRLLAKKRRKCALITGAAAAVIAVFIGAAFLLSCLTSYKAKIRRGNAALSDKNYVRAEENFKKAVAKDNKRPEAYKGLADIYLLQEDAEKAESVFLDAISSQPSNAGLYRAAVEFYLKTEQLFKIPELIADCDYENVLESLNEYISQEPQYSLPEGTYDEVQEVAVSSDGGAIYYTLDGSVPTEESERYYLPILLEEEGVYIINAVSFNENGIPSLVVSKKYTIELPMEDAPSVSPSTGQYEADIRICIDVPEGYTAYYTTDNTDPSDPSSHAIHYTGPVDMPEGQTIFSAVLMNNATGKYTQVTKRSYILEYGRKNGADG